MLHSGLGQHIYYLSVSPYLPQRLSQLIKCYVKTEIVGLVSTMFARISICFLLLRIFEPRRSWRITLYAIMSFAIATNTASALVLLLSCRPLQHSWNPLLVKGKFYNPEDQLALGNFQGGTYSTCYNNYLVPKH